MRVALGCLMSLFQSRRRRIPASRWVLLVLALESAAVALPAQEGDGVVASTAPAGVPTVRAPEAPQQRGRQRSRRRTRRVRRPATPPLRHTTPKGAPALASDLGTMLGARVRSGRWGVMVVSLTRGDTLYSVNPDLLLSPASNMKLFTAALALDQFGPDHQFSTDILREGVVTADGTLEGNLVMRGDGDPALSSRFLQGGAAAPVELLAQLVASRGIKRVSGDLVADATAFDQRRIPDGWQRRFLHNGYAARVSALSLNENLLWIIVQPGATSKQPAQIVLDPATELPVSNKVRTRAGSRAARVIVRTLDDGTIEVRGWIGARAGTRRYQIVVEDPARFTAGAFRRALEAAVGDESREREPLRGTDLPQRGTLVERRRGDGRKREQSASALHDREGGRRPWLHIRRRWQRPLGARPSDAAHVDSASGLCAPRAVVRRLPHVASRRG